MRLSGNSPNLHSQEMSLPASWVNPNPKQASLQQLHCFKVQLPNKARQRACIFRMTVGPEKDLSRKLGRT